MATRSSVLAWRIPGMVESDGLPSMGSHRVGHDWSDAAAAAAAAAAVYIYICMYVCMYVYIYMYVRILAWEGSWTEEPGDLATKQQQYNNCLVTESPGSSVHEPSQARILERAAISFSQGSSRPRDQSHVPCIGRQILYHWATWEAFMWLYTHT